MLDKFSIHAHTETSTYLLLVEKFRAMPLCSNGIVLRYCGVTGRSGTISRAAEALQLAHNPGETTVVARLNIAVAFFSSQILRVAKAVQRRPHEVHV